MQESTLFLDRLDEIGIADIEQALYPVQQLNEMGQYIWVALKLPVLRESLARSIIIRRDREPVAGDIVDGIPSFFVRESTETVWFSSGDTDVDWVQLSQDIPDELTNAQITDGDNQTFGTLSGERFKEGFDENAGNLELGDTNLSPEQIRDELADLEDEERLQAEHIRGFDDAFGLLSDEIKQGIKDALGIPSYDDVTVELNENVVQVKEGGIRNKHIASDLDDDEKQGIKDKISVAGADNTTIELESNNFGVKEGSLSDEHIKSDIGDNGKREFREKIGAIGEVSELTPTQIEDESDITQGTISGERFKEGFDQHAGDLNLGHDNVQANWDEQNTADHAYIRHKPDTITQDQSDKLAGIDPDATEDQTPEEIATAMEGRVRDEHIADDLTENEKSEARSRLGADTVDVDDETIENDDTDGLRVKAGGLDDSHIKENLSAAEKQEFRHRIDAEEEGAGGGGGSGIISEAVGTSGSMSINPAQTFISTGITLPSASEADWILLMMSFTSFDYAEWIWIRLQDILDLNASEVDDTPRTSTNTNDFIVIPHPLVSDNSDILLGRTSTNVLLIGTYQASVTFAGITVTLRRVSESTNGDGGSGEDTDITIERDADSVDVQSSTGGDGTIPAADTDNAGVLTADQFDKLESVEENAKDDQTGAEIKTAYEDEDDTNTFTDDERSKLDSVPDDITEPLLIFARSDTEPHHPTGAVSDTGVLSLDGEWDRFIPLAVGGSRSGTISLRSNNENPTGVARHGGQTYVANDGPTTNDKRFFVYNASGLPIALYNLHDDNEDPQAITITPDGNVFIADGAGEEFFQYTTAGVYVNRHSFPSGANITGAGSDENYLYFLNSSIRQVYVYFHGGGANPSRNRTLPFTGTHNFRGYTFANGRDYVLNSTGSDHEILVYRNGIRLTSEEQDLDSDNAAARGLGIDGSRFFVADSSDNLIYIYGDEDVNENPLFVAEAYVNLSDNTVTFSEFFQVDVSRFNLYDDVENELDALADDDRFLVVDYSADGRPNRYIDYSDLRDALRTEIEFNLHDDVDTELTSPANDDRMLIADESETGNPQRFIRYQTAKDDIRPSVEGDGSTVVSSPTHINVTGDGGNRNSRRRWCSS